EADERAKNAVAQPRGVLHDRVEDGLHVGRRLTDDAEDLARRTFPVAGLRQRSPKFGIFVGERRHAIAQRCNFSEQVCVRLAWRHKSVLTPARSSPLLPAPARTACPSRDTSSSR